jgi:uncharacterized protein YjbI with pentapeptide repeats
MLLFGFDEMSTKPVSTKPLWDFTPEALRIRRFYRFNFCALSVSVVSSYRNLKKSCNTTRCWLTLFIALLLLPALACQNLKQVASDEVASSNLRGKNFRYRQMAGMDLSNKNLRRVDFTGSDMRDVNFSNSDLTGANFELTLLLGADFTDATLDIKWARISNLLTTWEGAGQNFSGHDLSLAYLYGANLVGANLHNANLTKAHLVSADLEGAELSDANLTETNLSDANLRNANFTDANTTRVDLGYANLTGATITQGQLNVAKLRCTRMPDGTIYDDAACNGTPPPP